MEIGWVVRKKRSRRVPIAKDDMFKMLPKELHIEIMKRLVVQHLSVAMCVSKPWRNLILSSCVPTPSLAIRNLDHVAYIENEGKDNNGQYSFHYRFSSLVNDINPFPFKDTIHLFRWCSKVMGCNFDLSKHIIGSFNGLLLFCHNEGRAGNQTYGSCHYYAINPITKQCVAVLNPLPHSTPYSSYVALAYDPSESWYFRIVQFKGCCHVNVFSSETGCWTSLSLQLPQNVTEAAWDKKLVYSKGAIYWLSTSGHVIKLLLDAQESAKKQAVAIELPDDDSVYYHKCIALINGKVVFVSLGENLRIWKPMEYFDEVNGCTLGWILINCADIRVPLMKKVNRDGEFLGIHPYYEVIFYKLKNDIYYYFYHYNTVGTRLIEKYNKLYAYLKMPGFPFLECSTPFCCCLDMEHPRLFQRLPIPEHCRKL